MNQKINQKAIRLKARQKGKLFRCGYCKGVFSHGNKWLTDRHSIKCKAGPDRRASGGKKDNPAKTVVVEDDEEFAEILRMNPLSGAGAPMSGRNHDSRIFKSSNAYATLQSEGSLPASTRVINDVLIPYHILADSAFEQSTSLITPYRHRDTASDQEKTFNKRHSRRVEMND